MASIRMLVSCSMSDDSLNEAFQRSTSAKYADVQALSQFLQKLNSGLLKGPSGSAPSIRVTLPGNEVQATGTFVLTSVVATDAISINGVTFTAVASGATGNQFNVGVDDAATATNLANAINASVTALVTGVVTAARTDDSPATVTVTAVNGGAQGNLITIASADGTIVASGARLTGGAVDPGEKLYTF